MKNKMLKLFMVLIVISTTFILIKPKDMSLRQSVLKLLYPVIMLVGKLFPSKNAVLINTNSISPMHLLYHLSAVTTTGDTVSFSQFKGKKIMIVNTASDCGYTGQYEELEKLYQQNKDKLILIAFPANDFKEQEKADDKSIAQFCKKNYGISFLLMRKVHVIKDSTQDAVFKWLSHAEENGWCNQAPTWNFCKYVIDEKGTLTHFFANTISPLDKKVIQAIK